VTVDSTGSMPQVRYFHAAEIVNSRREIYVYGGLSQICHGDDKCTSQVFFLCRPMFILREEPRLKVYKNRFLKRILYLDTRKSGCHRHGKNCIMRSFVIIFFARCFGDETENEVGVACSTYDRNEHIKFCSECLKGRPHGRLRHEWEKY
jgi:hypothetical protein